MALAPIRTLSDTLVLPVSQSGSEVRQNSTRGIWCWDSKFTAAPLGAKPTVTHPKLVDGHTSQVLQSSERDTKEDPFAVK